MHLHQYPSYGEHCLEAENGLAGTKSALRSGMISLPTSGETLVIAVGVQAVPYDSLSTTLVHP